VRGKGKRQAEVREGLIGGEVVGRVGHRQKEKEGGE